MVDLESSELDPGILRFCVSPKFTCSNFLLNVTFLCEPGLISDSGFEHPASTLSTRFPAALGIGHGMPAA